MSTTLPHRIPGRRRWLFRLALAGFIPLALGLFEIFLRLTGFGLPSAFAIKNMNPVGLPLFSCRPIGDGIRECETSRFFKGYIAPQKFRLPKPAGTVRIFCLGESVAAGYPYDFPGSFSAIMQAMLDEGRGRFEVINVAVPGIRSEDIRRVAIEVADYEPDWLMLYMGNNEYLDLDPAAEVGVTASVRHWLRGHFLGLRLYPFFVAMRIRLQAQPAEAQSDFLREAIATRKKILSRPWTQPASDAVLHRFERNLADIADLARNHGARALIATVPVNLRDYYPFPKQDFVRADGCLAPAPGSTVAPAPAAAAEANSCVGGFPPDETIPATAAYREGCCALWAGNPDRARKYFVLALERDRQKMRATPEVNAVIRRVATAKGMTLAEVEAVFSSASLGHIPGDDLFLDQVHPDLRGQAMIARAMIDALTREGVAPDSDALRGQMDRAAQEWLGRIPAQHRADSLATLAGRIANSGFFTRSLRLYRLANAIAPAPGFADKILLLERLIAAGTPPDAPVSPD